MILALLKIKKLFIAYFNFWFFIMWVCELYSVNVEEENNEKEKRRKKIRLFTK